MAVNVRVSKVQESATLAVMAKAAKLKAEGKDIIDVSTGEPDIDTPLHIQEAAIKAIREGKTRYTPAPGLPVLREALAEKFLKDNGIKTTAAQIVVTNGGKQALHAAIDVIVEPGDEVIIFAPYWVSFPAMVALSGATSKFVVGRPENGYRVDPKDLAAALTPRTKAVIINTPSNPCGVAYSESELRALFAPVIKHSCYVIADEVYEKCVFDGFKHVSVAVAVPEIADRVITVNAFSKSYAMTGWRCGFVTGPADIAAAIAKHQSQTTSNVNTPTQYAALAALQGPKDFMKEMMGNFDRRLTNAIATVSKGPGLSVANKPQGAFYLFIRFDAKRFGGADKFDSLAFATKLLEEGGVAAVPGAAFGDDGALRMSVGTKDAVVDEAVKRIVGMAAKLAK